MSTKWFCHPSLWHWSPDHNGLNSISTPTTDPGSGAPWETTQLNTSDGLTFDYTHIHPDDPPSFVPFQFEIYDWRYCCTFAAWTWYLPLLTGVIYLLTIFNLEKYMKGREAFRLKWPLFLWNASLGIFSIVGFVRCAPEFFSILLAEGGVYRSMCFRDGGNYPIAFWGWVFALSKYVELGDTIFIILRKRPLQFIQWYHHLVTMTMTWLLGPLLEPILRWYLVMNYFVHSLMYPYFALMAIGVKIPRRFAITITTCQLTQMLIGLLVNLSTAVLINMGVPCYRHPFSIRLSFAVYGSFSVLFAKLFFDVFSGKNKVKEAVKKQKQGDGDKIDRTEAAAVASHEINNNSKKTQ